MHSKPKYIKRTYHYSLCSIFYLFAGFLSLLLTILSPTLILAQTTVTFSTTGTWKTPAGVTTITVECWGGGGGGGGAAGNPSAGGGGSGGAYTKSTTISVTPGTTYTVTVGAGGTAGISGGTAPGGTGGVSWFNTSGTIQAVGGSGGAGTASNSVSAAGASAVITGNVGGSTNYYGGSGGTGGASGASGGGGGGSGGSAATGNNASVANGGAAVTDGGAGANGSTASAAGAAGSAPGGGGAGGRAGTNTNRAGGAGGAGQVKITYTCNASPAALTLSEGFNATSIPGCWTTTIVTDPGTDPALTYVASGTAPTCSPSEGADMVKFNSNTAASGAQIRLESPVITTGTFSGINITFDWLDDRSAFTTSGYIGEGITVQYSTDGGNSWTNSTAYDRIEGTGTSTTWVSKSLDIGTGASSNLKVGLLFTGKAGNNCYFDNLSISGINACTTPSAQPTSLSLTPGSTTIAATFTAASPAPNGYLVIRTPTSSAPTNPVDGTIYIAGSSALGGYIESVGASTSYTSSGLLPSTQYWYWVYSYNNTGCYGGPTYRTASPLFNNATTIACSGVSNKYWAGLGTVLTGGTSGTDFNTNGNWSSTGPTGAATLNTTAPNACDDITMTTNDNATITLNSSTTIKSLVMNHSGANKTFVLKVNSYSLTVDGATSTNVTSGNVSTLVRLDASTGAFVFGGNVTYAATSGYTSTHYTSTDGSGTYTYKGNVIFNSGAQTPSVGTGQPQKVIFDALASQSVNNNQTTSNIYLGNVSTEIGSANSPIVTIIGNGSNTMQVTGNLNINGTSTLDLGTYTLNRSTSGGTFSLASGATFKLAGITGGQTGSNFPTNFTTLTFNAASNTDYNGTGAQTIYSTPAYGNLLVSNNSVKTAGGGLTINGNFTINTTATFAASTYTHNIGSNYTNSGTFTANTSNLTFTSTATGKTLGGTLTGASGKFYNLTFNDGEGAGAWSFSNDAEIANSLVITYGTVIAPAGTLTLTGNWSNSGSFLHNNGTMLFNATTTGKTLGGTLSGATGKFYNLTFNGAGGGWTLNSATDVVSAFTVTAGTLTSATSTLSVGGNWTNNATFTHNSGTVTFNGTSSQTISGTGGLTFYNAITNNTAGVVLSNAATINNNLTMTAGNISNGTNIITLGTAAATPGTITWTSGTILGTLKRWFNAGTNSGDASGLFPVGNSTYNRWLRLEYTSGHTTGGTLEVFWSNITPTFNTGLPLTDGALTVTNVANEGRWEIVNSGNTATALYTLTMRGNGFGTCADPANIRIVKSPDPHTTWTLDGSHGTVTGSCSDFTISRTGMSNFSWLTFGGDNNNPLPIELLSFTAQCNQGHVDILWATASETNNEYFVIEKSMDAIDWTEIHREPGANNSNVLKSYYYVDYNPSIGQSYYRLRQIDYNGDTEAFEPVSMNSCFDGSENTILIYPHPATDMVTILVEADQAYANTTINIHDMMGRNVYSHIVNIVKGENKFTVELEEYRSGDYTIVVQSDELILPVEKMIIQK